MSKKSRTFQPPTTTSGSAGGRRQRGRCGIDPRRWRHLPGRTGRHRVTHDGSGDRHVAIGGTPAGLHRGRVSAPPSFFERYRALIIGAIAVLVVGGTVAVVAEHEHQQRQRL